VGLFSGTEKRTPAEWKERLTLASTPVTLDEYVAGVLLHLAGSALQTRDAAEHLEGMLGAIDDAIGRHDPDYARSATVRAALDRQRDTARYPALANGTEVGPSGRG
jgi:hypothetical protein